MKTSQTHIYPKNSYRRKLLEAIVFFSQKGKIHNPSKMMIYKLLAELDFRHFKVVGLPVTNQNYEALNKGPVPQPFHNEITKGKKTILPDDFKEALTIEDTVFENEKGKKCRGFKFIAKRKPNLKVFSPRQIDLLEDISLIYRTSTATEASDISHEPGTPWTITVAKKGEHSFIDLLDTVKVDEPLTQEMASEKLKERAALDYNY